MDIKSIIFHYPPELFAQLVDTIPLLCRSKTDVLLFFRGAGIEEPIYADLSERVATDRKGITKYEIVRNVLTRLNDKGEVTLRERREILKRVVEFEDFSTCWPDDQLKVKGLIAEIRRVIDVKDTFTRIKKEYQDERRRHIAQQEAKAREVQEKKNKMEEIKRDLYSLFGMQNHQKRGVLLESILNRLFKLSGILVRESFRLLRETGHGVLEQIDGVIEFDGHLYLVEMKWISDTVGKGDVSNHLVGVYHRGHSRGIFISATEFTQAAIEICREALQRTVVVLCLLEELIRLLENESDLREMLRLKIQAAITEKNPLKKII
jgi:restriction system protein